MAIRAILFDAVGTLIEPHPPVAAAYKRHGDRYGSTLAEPEILERFKAAYIATDWSGTTCFNVERNRWRGVVDRVFAGTVTDPRPLFEDLWKHFAEPQHWRLFPDVLPSWSLLEERGYQLGIASNFDQRLLGIAEHFKPLSQAKALFCSAEFGFSKPDVKFFRAAEQELGLPATELLMVGNDLQNDVFGPRSAGWQAIHLDRDGVQLRPDSIKSLREVLSVISKR